MKKIEFKNYEDSPTTPINAQALNAMQDNMEEAIETKVNTKVDKTYVDTELGKKANKHFLPRAEITNLDFNKTEEEWGSVRYDIATRQVTQGKPMGDGFVTTYFWDNSGKFDSQLYIPNGETNSRVPQWRSRSNDDQWGEWQDINPSSTYVQVQLSGNFTLNANNKRFDNLYRGAYNGSGLTVSTTGVTIGAGISTIEISAMYYYRHLASSGERDLYMEIRKGSTVINRISKSFSATSVSEGMAFAPFYVDVEQGDKIEMWATNTGGGDSYMAGYHSTTGPRTHLLIKKVR